MARRLAVAGVLAVVACDRRPQERANDTIATLPSPPDTAVTVQAPTAESSWDSAAGPVFLVMGASGTRAAVVRPEIDSTASLDTLTLSPGAERSLAFEVFQGSRILGQVRVGERLPQDIPQDCSTWPAVRLSGVSDSATWSVAFASGHFSPLALDSLASMTRPDSSRLSRDIARVASSVPGDTTDALRGLPYVVRRAWSFVLPSGGEVVLAEVGRALNQEANPVQEQLHIVAERDSANDRLTLAYASRMVGGEEGVETLELLAAGNWRGRDQPVALVARYLGDGVIYGVLTRRANGRWVMTWASPYVGC